MNKRRVPNNSIPDAVPCQEPKLNALLSRYQDNELDVVTHEKISTHLTECQACRTQLHTLEQITLAIQTLPEVETNPNFTAQLMARVSPRYQERRSWSNLFAMPSLVYSLVFLVFLGLGLWGIGAIFQPDIFFSTHQVTAQVLDNDFTQVFSQSQQLSLMHVQDQSFDLLAQSTHVAPNENAGQMNGK